MCEMLKLAMGSSGNIPEALVCCILSLPTSLTTMTNIWFLMPQSVMKGSSKLPPRTVGVTFWKRRCRRVAMSLKERKFMEKVDWVSDLRFV